jgi:hypothetical protein
MESLNLNTLASSLPTANLQNAEKDLLNNFKAAALSITTLYRSSRHTSKRAYNAGYAAACQDLLLMIQQGVSVGGISSSHDSEGGGMTIGKVMDWIEARLEAIKSREEEEDEDEEREKERERERGKPSTSTSAAVTVKTDQVVKATINPPSVVSQSTSNRQKEKAASMPPTPNSPRSHVAAPMSSQPSSPSPPPGPASRAQHMSIRPSKSRSSFVKDPSFMTPNTPSLNAPCLHNGFSFSPATPTPAQGEHAGLPIPTGAKRRHAVMMMLESASSPVSLGGSSPDAHAPLSSNFGGVTNGLASMAAGAGRRRTRSARGHHTNHQSQNQNANVHSQQVAEAMDVEEDSGRERKRIARR